MSILILRSFCSRVAVSLAVAALAAAACTGAAAQQTSVVIRVLPDSSRVGIEGSCAPMSLWSFRDSYAGVLGLGSRIDRFALSDEQGNEIPFRRIAPGQYESAKPGARFRYEVSLAPPPRASDSALVSWLTKERGVLMLRDLLPTLSSPNAPHASVRFELPSSWEVYSNFENTSQKGIESADVASAVFGVGSRVRTSRMTESGMTFGLVTDGDWAFTDADVIEMCAKVLRSHREVFGAMPAKQGTLILFPFPQNAGANQWSAETNGSTVTLVMGNLPARIAALAQLSTALTHELFHLWVPNGLALDSNYDWFYEGFTIYQAVRTAVGLDLLTLQEFLNAIAYAYDAYKNVSDSDRFSLIDASKQRWTTGATSVYSKSFVIAFIYDLRLRSLRHRKQSLDNVYRELFRGHQTGSTTVDRAAADGNEAVTSALAAFGMDDYVRSFIRNPVSINLSTELAPFGLKVETTGSRTRISVGDQLNKQQRDLLRQLGYNDATHATRSR